MRNCLFTSESVTSGHPDKIADQIADGILDVCLEQDPNSRVACEVLVTTNQVVIAGEITSQAIFDIDEEVLRIIESIGYTNPEYGFDTSCNILNLLDKQSPDIALGVDSGGAGDQGMVFGGACNETKELMPLPISIARDLTFLHTFLMETGQLEWLRPDGKSQVSVRYDKNGKPTGVDTVVIAAQHDPDISQSDLKQQVISKIITPTLEKYEIDITDVPNILINSTGRFVIGGPAGDTGLTGRKIIVDTYGGYFNIGGGALSGKDPTKVDRSGAYMARYIAKNIVTAGLADKCEVQISYAIGVEKPTSLYIDCYGTERIDIGIIERLVVDYFPIGVTEMIDFLGLKTFQYYQDLAGSGHFGWSHLPWEQTNMITLFNK